MSACRSMLSNRPIIPNGSCMQSAAITLPSLTRFCKVSRLSFYQCPGSDLLFQKKGSLQGSSLAHKKNSSRGHGFIVKSQVNVPVFLPSDTWGIWTVLLSSAAFGLWSERTTWGNALSGALVSTLVGLAASNLGLVPSEAPVYGIVNSYLLPLAVPLLLYAADMKRVLTSTGKLLVAFSVGSLATIVGTIVAMIVVPLRSLGSDGWKIAAALMSRHIGGAVNYVAVSEALGVSSSVIASGLAADNLICAIYFTTLFALASSIPSEQIKDTSGEQVVHESRPHVKVLDGSIALALSGIICTCGVYLAKFLGLRGGSIPCITGLVVLLATMFPSLIGPLAPSGEGLAIMLMQVFFATVGANGNIRSVIQTAPSLFLFSFIQIAVHLVILLGIGKFLGFEQKQLLLASNANVGGPTTAAGMATAKGWRSLVIPGILAGIFGIAIATFLSIALGIGLLQKL